MLYIGNTRYKVANKPYDAEIEYLQSTGTQWIDLDYYADQYTSMTAKFQYTATTAQQYLFSIRDAWDVMFGFYINGSSKFAFSFNNATHYNATKINLAANTSLHTLSISACNTNGTVVFDNKTINLSGGTRNPGSIRLFGAVGTPPYGRPKMKLYNISFSRNGVLDCDLIPVRKGTTGYMYDKVSGKLYGNSGTDTFTLGPDKYDSEVQYIESTGTQYINTGIGFKKSLSTRIQFCLTKLNSNNQLLYGAWADNSSYPKTQFLTNSSNVFAPVYETEYVSARLTDTGSTINGTAAYSNKFYDVTVLSPAQSASTLNCYLFARDNDVNNYLPYNGLRLYACKMTQDGVVVRDFIPVRKNGVGYLYDKISDQLFGNIGTGNFIIGPDINIRARIVKFTPQINLSLNKICEWNVDNWSSGNWVDNVGNRSAIKTGSPAKVTINGTQYLRVSYNNYFTFSLNNSTNGINMGDVWRVDVEFMLEALPSGNSSYITDFGSLTTATHAFAIAVSQSGILGFNAKLDGNNSNSLYNINRVKCDIGKLTTVSLGMERYDSTKNRMYLIYKGLKYYSPNTISRTKATFNKNFVAQNLYIGRGYAANTYQTTANKYIKSIKIYSLM